MFEHQISKGRECPPINTRSSTTYTDSEPFTIEEVEKAVKTLKNNKACGWDKIAAETIKKGGNAMNQMLLKISNLAWLEGETPEDWSKGLM